MARFGRQAAAGLHAWAALQPGDVELRIEDDRSDAAGIPRLISQLGSSCDVVLGPYSSALMRAAATGLAETRTLLWNHGGAADDVQRSRPGQIVSVLTPARRYSEPFLRRVSGPAGVERLLIIHGKGGFARQVAAGVESVGCASGLQVESFVIERGSPGRSNAAAAAAGGKRLAVLCAGSFEEDLDSVRAVRSWSDPPSVICAVAAGVREFGSAVAEPIGIHGIAQWLAGRPDGLGLGPTEEQFVAAFRAFTGSLPDYPAAQAAATAALAVHCVEVAGSTHPAAVWDAAVRTEVRTFFGDFAIQGETGEQIAHETVLTLWTDTGLSRAG